MGSELGVYQWLRNVVGRMDKDVYSGRDECAFSFH